MNRLMETNRRCQMVRPGEVRGRHAIFERITRKLHPSRSPSLGKMEFPVTCDQLVEYVSPALHLMASTNLVLKT
jgi:hypothetical protein